MVAGLKPTAAAIFRTTIAYCHPPAFLKASFRRAMAGRDVSSSVSTSL
jgi:hypothetical protein